MPASKKTSTRVVNRPRRPKSGKLCCARLAPLQVNITHDDEVERYVRGHPDLESSLETICAKVRQEFGPEAELALELYKDPELPDQYLTLYVRQGKYDVNIMDRIEAVSSQFMAQLEETSGHLLITTDFRRPRG